MVAITKHCKRIGSKQMYSATVLEATSLKSRCWQVPVHPKALEQDPSFSFSFWYPQAFFSYDSIIPTSQFSFCVFVHLMKRPFI